MEMTKGKIEFTKYTKIGYALPCAISATGPKHGFKKKNLRVHFLSLHLTKVGLSLISETSACTRSSEGAITNDGVIGWNSINIMVVKVHTCKSYLSSYTSLE